MYRKIDQGCNDTRMPNTIMYILHIKKITLQKPLTFLHKGLVTSKSMFDFFFFFWSKDSSVLKFQVQPGFYFLFGQFFKCVVLLFATCLPHSLQATFWTGPQPLLVFCHFALFTSNFWDRIGPFQEKVQLNSCSVCPLG